MDKIDMIKNLIINLGISATIVIVILSVLKKFIVKFVETVIENVITEKTSKNVEKYINDLKRKTIVYENLINKELSFYEKTEIYISDILVEFENIEYDYVKYIKEENENNKKELNKKILEELMEVLDKIIIFKKDIVMYGNYMDKELRIELIKLLATIKSNNRKISDSLIKNDILSKDEINRIVEEILKQISFVQILIQEKYKKLSE